MSSSELDRYPFKECIIVNKIVEFGEVFLINDRLISIPDADRVRDERNLHPERRVVIVQNDEGIYSSFPTLLVAPLSTRTDLKRKYDILVLKDQEPAVTEDVLIHMNLIQPILRADLGDSTGILSEDKRDEILRVAQKLFGLEI